MRRGESPNVPAAAVANAAGVSHAADGWSADATRSGQLPEVDVSTPGTWFGRWLLPGKLLVELLCDAPIGNPDCHVNTAATVQPPANRLPMRLLPMLWSLPNGSATIGATTKRCGVSRTPGP